MAADPRDSVGSKAEMIRLLANVAFNPGAVVTRMELNRLVPVFSEASPSS
jgi:hypothetical protein